MSAAARRDAQGHADGVGVWVSKTEDMRGAKMCDELANLKGDMNSMKLDG